MDSGFTIIVICIGVFVAPVVLSVIYIVNNSIRQKQYIVGQLSRQIIKIF